MIVRNKHKARVVLVGSALALLILTAYFTVPFTPHRQISRQQNSKDDASDILLDEEGVLIDMIEMSVADFERDTPNSVVHSTMTSASPVDQQKVKGQQTDVGAAVGAQGPGSSHGDVDSDPTKDEMGIETQSLVNEAEDGTLTKLETSETLLSGINLKVPPVLDVSGNALSKNLLNRSVQLEKIVNHEIESERFDSLPSKPTNQFLPSHAKEVLTLPVPFATLPLKELLQQQWVHELQEVLKLIPRGPAPVSIVSADYKFRDVLVNWIIAAKTQASPPLTHVVVFSLDQVVSELLRRRHIHCIFVSPSNFLTSKAISSLTKHIVFSEVMVLRLTAMRLINYWGYDVANYDTDAIVLKSPESLYLRHANSHMIGSYGHSPGELGRKWGTTVCCGLFMTRSSPYTEIFWNKISTIQPNSMNDQARINFGLATLQPDWGNTDSKSIMKDEWVATTTTGFNVTVLPAKYICRQLCSGKHRSEYYVWHKGGVNSDGKMKTAQRGRLWFLRHDWENRTTDSSATGEEWLREITAPV